MSRQVPVRLALLVMAALACSLPAGLGGREAPASPFHPSSDTHLEAGEHRFTELTVPEDVTVTLEGDVLINVEGPIRIDGTLTGDCTAVEIRGTEDLTLDGLISNTCPENAEAEPEVRLIAEGDITVGTTSSDEEAIVSGGAIFIANPGGEELDFTPILPENQASAFRPRTASRLRAPAQRPGGASGVRRPLRARRGITIARDPGAVAVGSLTAGDGDDAQPLEQAGTCDNPTKGGAGGSIRLAAPHSSVEIAAGARLKAGDGGMGGSCIADEGCPAVATAAAGGLGGSVLIGGESIEFGQGVTLVIGNGGEGGYADAMGNDGQEQCANGCDATATGGKGGNAGGTGYLYFEPGTITGAPRVEGANGGEGGWAYAGAGNGADCPTCPAGSGGNGGTATATGGQGGNSPRDYVREWQLADDSHQKGDGGDAEADGGEGGAGATCCNPPKQGGNGGDGGDATAVGGQVGARGLRGGTRGRSEGSTTGDGGDGGDGEPPGSGGKPGGGTGDPDAVELGEKGEDGQRCFKVWIVFIGYLMGGHEHFEGYSDVIFVVFVLGRDPVPMPNATVTIRMTRPDGSSETLTAVTDPDGTATGRFTIYTYGDYTLTVEDIEGENMVYDPTLNQMDSIVIGVGPAEGRIPDPATVIVKAFLEAFVAAIQSGDIEFLFEHLHPAVAALYGDEQCQAYLEGVADPTFDIEVLGVSGPGSWQWEIDDRSTPIPNTYTVSVNRTVQGQTSGLEIHLAPDDEGRLRWFTDCGDPLP